MGREQLWMFKAHLEASTEQEKVGVEKNHETSGRHRSFNYERDSVPARRLITPGERP
jgi:hypothetical protein